MKLSALAVAIGATAALFSTGAASAATASTTDNVIYAAAGSSALFNVFLAAAKSVTGSTAQSVNVSNGAFVVDHAAANSPAAVNEKGNIWIVWNALPGDATGTPTGTRNIYFYVSVDSTVGDRAFFKGDGAQIISTNTGFSSVPADVVSAVNASTINAGMTDIRPEDALVATQRAYGFGYSTTNPIKDGATQIATPVAFSLSARPSLTTSIGASPIIVFLNNATNAGTNTSVLGGVNDISSTNLSKTLDGTLASSTSFLAPTQNVMPLTTFIREPLSGTYNTTEFCEPHAQQFQTTQENNVSSVPADGQNPLDDAGVPLASSSSTQGADFVLDNGTSSVGGRVRAIGTGALVRGVNSCANAFGYAFWSTGNFAASKAGNTKYITVDGVDPLISTYAGGIYPAGSSVTFQHIADGTYRIWSVLRIVTESPEPAAIGTLVNNAVNQDSGGDFIAAGNLKVFRSHRSVAVAATGPDGGKISDAVPSPSNGRSGEPAEAGSDVGGTVYSDALETANGAQLLNTRL